ncbi:MAG: hypothetical protein J3K34DRAFT_416719, partial [Monoraphidium minutum]
MGKRDAPGSSGGVVPLTKEHVAAIDLEEGLRRGGGGGGAAAADAAAARRAAAATALAAAAAHGVKHVDSPGSPKPPELPESPEDPKGCMERVACSFQDYRRNVRERPLFMLLPPLLTFALLCAASVAGVVLGASDMEADTRARAASAALDWAASFRLSAEKIFTPLVTLSILIQQNPDFGELRTQFPAIARELLESVNQERVVIQELQLSPMGVIGAIYPSNNDTDSRLGINIFQEPALRGGAINTLQQRRMVLNGPLKLVQGNFGTIARIPIYIRGAARNETFGTNKTAPDDCPPALCYSAATREKFWGFATAIGPLDDLRAGNDSRLDLLKTKGYRWLMTRAYTATERNDSSLYRPESTDRNDQYVFANSSVWPSGDAVGSDINIGNSLWHVYLEPEEGWRPPWERGLIATVVLASAVTAGLVGVIMASWAQQRRLLGSVMESNVRLADTTAKLQEEKLRLDALLVRQYNLLAVLGGPKARAAAAAAGCGGG